MLKERFLKRLFDLLFSAVILIIASPIMLLVAIGIKLDSPGPVIFAGKRIGRDGKPFDHYRFRTRTMDAVRHTRFGRFIGNLSLDDLPTFWNVIKGDLNLIGPRPALLEEADLADPAWQKVLSVKPGLTGHSLVVLQDKYSGTPMRERIQLA